jgi:hypothetical protein
MKLAKYQMEAIKAAKLRLEQSRWPDCNFSVAVKTAIDERGNGEFIVTRSLKAASERDV